MLKTHTTQYDSGPTHKEATVHYHLEVLEFNSLLQGMASSTADVVDTVTLRQLGGSDFQKGFLQLLSQLTVVGDVSKEAFEGRLAELEANEDYYIAVAEDASLGKLVGTAALIIERKFIHDCGKVGHIEDVVVDAAARGKNLGKRLIDELLRVSKAHGCYKVILDCSEANQPFYEKCGLIRKEVQMVKYLDR